MKSEAQKRAEAKWKKENYTQISIKLSKKKKEEYERLALKSNCTIQKLMRDLLEAELEKEEKKND